MTPKSLFIAALIAAYTCSSCWPQRNADPESWIWVDPTPVNGLVHETLFSQFMHREIGVNVFLPPSYETKPQARFPVVYFLHGASGTERSDADFHMAQRLMQDGKIPESIFVFPNGGQYSRYRDWPDQSVKVESYFIRELMPHIDATYRTIADRSARALSGWSMGGDASLRLASKYPELFCVAATFSAAIDWRTDEDEDTIAEHCRRNVERIRDRIALKMSVGEDDRLIENHRRLLPLLDELKIAYTFQSYPGVGHNLGKMKELAAEETLLFIGQHLLQPSEGPIARKPVLLGESRRICSMPDLGELNGSNPKLQHIVDHGFLQRRDKSWLLWACLRGTQPGRLLVGWQTRKFDEDNWQSLGVVQRASEKWGEPTTPEAIGAPYFLQVRDEVYCFYHARGIRMMTSYDGITFTRAGEPPDGALLYEDGGRDVMVMEHNGQYYAYSTVSTREGMGFVVLRKTADFKHWTPRQVVSSGGIAGSGPVSAESPYVVKLDGFFYLFRASSTDFKTYVYRSLDPEDFGQNDDSKLVATLPIKAPEVFDFHGQWYISDLADFHGILLHRLDWQRD
ncbi:MAG: hypothetical protein KDB03_09755 [Planctomycetales bacterium]|nr:hypothetical protein [Planctomycetales bacterium]